MIESLKNIGRAVIPKSLFRAVQPYYHGLMSLLTNVYFGRPSRKLIVIGVTGTAGKSTVINLLAAILNHNGRRTGFTTTANYSNGNQEYINRHGLSMPGGFLLHRQLRNMVNHGCEYAIVEATSEGLAQNRHLGIKFSAALLTTLAPAHIDAHGNFENYRAAKGKLFAALDHSRGIMGINLDTQDADYFLNFKAAKKFGVTLESAPAPNDTTIYKPVDVVTEPTIKFALNGTDFVLDLIGEFNVYNTVLATACAHTLGVSLEQCATALKNFSGVSGRMQSVPNDRDIKIFVDYAPEPSAMENSLLALNRLPHKKIIHVFGSTGGHRDVNKRFAFGRISAQQADTILITNDDVYDSDPEVIARNVREGIEQASPTKVKEILTVFDRRQAIHRALEMAQSGDIVVITGKGSEQFLVLPGNKRVSWDEPSVVQEELSRL